MDSLMLATLTTNDTPSRHPEPDLAAGASVVPRTLEELFTDCRFSMLTTEHIEFLHYIAFLPHITAGAASRLSGRRDAEQLLEFLHQHRVCTALRGVQDTVFAVHPNLARLLIDGAAARFTEQKMLDLLTLAASMLEQDGMLSNALTLYVQAEKWEQAIALIAAHAPRLLRQGCHAHVAAGLMCLPTEIRSANADCQYWLGRSLPAHGPEHRLAAFELAATLYDANGQISGMLQCMSEAVVLLCQSETGGSRTSALLQRLHRALQAHEDGLPQPIKLCAYSALLRGMHFADVADAMVLRWAARLAGLLPKAASGEESIGGATSLLRCHVHFGFSRRAEALIAQHGLDGGGAQLEPLTSACWHIACGQHFYVMGEPGAAALAYGRAKAAADRAGLLHLDSIIMLHQLYHSLGTNQLTAAAEYLQQLEHRIRADAGVEQVFYRGALAWHALLCHRPAQALEHAQTLSHLAATLRIPVARGYALLAQAMTLIAHGDADKAELVFKKMQRDPILCNKGFFSPHTNLIGARLATVRGDQADAIIHLRSAFALLKQSHQLAPIFWLPSEMSALCALALEKGLETDFVTRLIKSRALAPPVAQAAESWPWPLRIYALGDFALFKDGQQIVFGGKAQRKPLDFLKALLSLGGDGVDVSILTHLLWPDAEGDAAQRSFHSTLHRLRKLVGYDEAVLLTDRKVSINTSYCWVDVWEFERLADQSSHAASGAAAGADEAERLGRRLLTIYRKDFLVSDDIQAWILPQRDKLRSKFLRLVAEIGKRLEHAGLTNAAIPLYERGLEVDCLAEELYRRLIEYRRQRGEVAEACSIYCRCRDMLSIVLGIAPSEKTRSLYRQMSALA